MFIINIMPDLSRINKIIFKKNFLLLDKVIAYFYYHKIKSETPSLSHCYIFFVLIYFLAGHRFSRYIFILCDFILLEQTTLELI